MTRQQWQKLAADRLADARALLKARRWAAAYYLAGYAVECALKACVLARVTAEPEVLFSDRRFGEKCWTHNLAQLLEAAGLTAALQQAATADDELEQNWGAVRDWNEASRYAGYDRAAARNLFNAITDRRHGVLSWLKARW